MREMIVRLTCRGNTGRRMGNAALTVLVGTAPCACPWVPPNLPEETAPLAPGGHHKGLPPPVPGNYNNVVEEKRIVVVGTTGSGKTTMARRLSARLHVPHIELDALNWGPGWQPRPRKEFLRSVAEATAGPAWVLDGNYSVTRDIVWPRAQLVVWLDFSLPRIMWQLWWRTWRRAFTREELWNGNVDRLLPHFTSRDSLFWWALSTYRRRRRTYERYISEGTYPHLRIVRLTSPSKANAWFAAREPALTP